MGLGGGGEREREREILVQYNLFMIFLNVNVLTFLLHVFKLMSLILVKLNCPVRDE